MRLPGGAVPARIVVVQAIFDIEIACVIFAHAEYDRRLPIGPQFHIGGPGSDAVTAATAVKDLGKRRGRIAVTGPTGDRGGVVITRSGKGTLRCAQEAAAAGDNRAIRFI